MVVVKVSEHSTQILYVNWVSYKHTLMDVVRVCWMKWVKAKHEASFSEVSSTFQESGCHLRNVLVT